MKKQSRICFTLEGQIRDARVWGCRCSILPSLLCLFRGFSVSLGSHKFVTGAAQRKRWRAVP